MPRGRKKAVPMIENIEERMEQVNAEIESLKEQLKAKKVELKELQKAKERSDKLAAERKAEEDKEAILAAVAVSGKSVDEILDFLK